MLTNASGNPFPGLRPFESDETHLFFGRKGQCDELLNRLKSNRFLAVVGTSGSGKSSLVKAGLLPALQGGLMASAGSDWRIALFRPGNDPIGNLACALMSPEVFGSGDKQRQDLETVTAETTLRRSSLGLIELVRQMRMAHTPEQQPVFANYENLLIVVDQFEELFRFKRLSEELLRLKQLAHGEQVKDVAKPSATMSSAKGESLDAQSTAGTQPSEADQFKQGVEQFGEDAAAFVKLLLEAARNADEKNIYVVLTMRSDYLGETAQFRDLPEAINDGQYLIPRMTRDERRAAITGPVAVGRGQITEPLVNQLLNDAGDNPGHLPLLQHALMCTWDYWSKSRRDGEAIDLEHYKKIGTMADALSNHAAAAYRQLPKRRRKIAEKVFKCLTEKGPDNREIRRPIELQEICQVVNADIEDVKAVVESFRQEDRSFLMPPADKPLEPDSVIDISHESLISGWKILKKWVNDEAQSAATYRRLAQTAVLHELGAEDYLRNPALQLALMWRKKNKPSAAWAKRYHPEYDKAIKFLEDSEARRKEYEENKERRLKEQAEKERLALENAAALAVERQQRAEIERQAAEEQTAARQRDLESAQKLAKEQQRIIEVERQRAEIERQAAEEQAASARELAQKQERLVIVERRRAEEQAKFTRRFKWLTVGLAVLLFATTVTAAGAIYMWNEARKAKGMALIERNDAQRLRAEAVGQAQRLEESLEAKAVATKKALEAEGEAKGERDKAQKAEAVAKAERDKAAKGEKKALGALALAEVERKRANNQVKLAGMYQGALDSSANGKRAEAAQTLDRVITFFDETNPPDKVQKQISALTNMGILLNGSENPEEKLKAVKPYERLVNLHHQLGQTAEEKNARIKIAEVYRNSDSVDNKLKATAIFREEKRFSDLALTYRGIAEKFLAENVEENLKEDKLKAAGYYQSSADAHRDANVPVEQAAMLIEAGTLYIKEAQQKKIEDDEKRVQESRQNGLQSGDEKSKLVSQVDNKQYRPEDKSSRPNLTAALQQKADELFQQAVAAYPQADAHAAAAIREQIAKIFAPLDKPKAASYYEQAAELYSPRESDYKIRQYRQIIDLYKTSENEQEKFRAADYYGKIVDTYGADRDREKKVSTLIERGDFYRELKNEKLRSPADASYDQAVAVYQAAADRAQKVATLIQIGGLHSDANSEADRAKAKSYYDKALNAYREANDPVNELLTLINIGKTHLNLKNEAERGKAEDYFKQAAAAHQAPGNSAGQSATFIEIGEAYLSADDEGVRQGAIKYFNDAVEVYRVANDRAGEAETLRKLGASYRKLEKRPEAIEAFGKALQVFQEIGNRAGESAMLINLGALFLESEKEAEQAQGVAYLDRAIQVYRDAGERNNEALALTEVAVIYALPSAEKWTLKAAQHYEMAGEIYRRTSQREEQAAALVNAAWIYGTLLNDEREKLKSITLYETSAGIFRQLGKNSEAADSYSQAAEIYKGLTKRTEAIAYFQKALELYQGDEDRKEKGDTLHAIALIYQAAGDKRNALDFFKQAQQAFKLLPPRRNTPTIDLSDKINLLEKELSVTSKP